jgi:hypothetical protein
MAVEPLPIPKLNNLLGCPKSRLPGWPMWKQLTLTRLNIAMLLCITKNILHVFDGCALVLPSLGITILTFKEQVESVTEQLCLVAKILTAKAH